MNYKFEDFNEQYAPNEKNEQHITDENTNKVVSVNIAEELMNFVNLWNEDSIDDAHKLLETIVLSIHDKNAYCDPIICFNNFMEIIVSMIYTNSHYKDSIIALYCVQGLMKYGFEDELSLLINDDLIDRVFDILNQWNTEEVATCIEMLNLIVNTDPDFSNEIAKRILIPLFDRAFGSENQIQTVFSHFIYIICQHIDDETTKNQILELLILLLKQSINKIDSYSQEVIYFSIGLLADTPNSFEIIEKHNFNKDIWKYIDTSISYPERLFEVLTHLVINAPILFELVTEITLKNLRKNIPELQWAVLKFLAAAVSSYPQHPFFTNSEFIQIFFTIANGDVFSLRKLANTVICMMMFYFSQEFLDIYLNNGIIEADIGFLDESLSNSRISKNISALLALLDKYQSNSQVIIERILQVDGLTIFFDMLDSVNDDELYHLIQVELLERYFSNYLDE
ncbi:hypothetical protein TVAG_379410 [Trichomonas vaginalis G3]|uniref:Uncharacterized protein n=1 Tax=Trichomonas vaginalis (strain ATCC PRA-98 / G3) TaxID=412133 RepID=A2E7G6_TRIV3|nr:armadillo (ARM) repeat-containing protein family [Trichomonas vaginalis G3]EAY11359.1 hypothetical protein TVAG_379410 [Trichomonas vaginalis G3]KAI5530524.1 armadillo (ARM) repeat-containing protein family [Trichomonas vaginalis G3]|eukprot:XP_001323582.1 hypothetical protein [Trichomonas vaginalis G3]